MAISGYPISPLGISSNAAEINGWGTGWPDCQSSKQVWITLSNGVSLEVRNELAELLELLLNEVLRRGYVIRDADSAGFVCRAIRKSNPPAPSNHSWGIAVDINWNTNPMYSKTSDIPVWMVELMWEYGFFWGGWYSSGGEDPMHFEFVLTPVKAAALTKQARLKMGPEMTPEESLWLEEVHSLLTTGKRLGPSQTANGGVPIADYARKFYDVGLVLKDIQSLLSTMSTSLEKLHAAVNDFSGVDDSVVVATIADMRVAVDETVRKIFSDAGSASTQP